MRRASRVHGIDIAVATCCLTFIAVLAISAYWDPAIRVLHLFEAVPYAVAAVLSMRRSKLGYALGFASGAFWLWYAGTLAVLSLAAYGRLRSKAWSDVGIFAGAIVSVIVFFVFIFTAFAPQYLTPLQRWLQRM